MSPVIRCENGKYKIGSGKCIYDSKAKAESAYKGYLASKREELKHELKLELDDLKTMDLKLNKVKELIKDGNDKRI